jgi:hypothetical protein
MNAPVGNGSASDFEAILRDSENCVTQARAHAARGHYGACQKALGDARHKLLAALDEVTHLEADQKSAPKRRKR